MMIASSSIRSAICVYAPFTRPYKSTAQRIEYFSHVGRSIVQFPQCPLSAGVVIAEPRIYDPFAASSACAHFRPKRGAIGATTNCENQNLVILGVSDAEIAFASRAIEKLGGYVTVTDGEFSPKFRPRPLAV
jgi:hypothetical protein